jgi:hypothetical protein
MFNNASDPDQEIRHWFSTYLINPRPWHLLHPEGKKDPNSLNDFRQYINDFKTLGYQVRDINHSVSNSNSILTLRRSTDKKLASISGRADYLICSSDSTPADCMYKTVCVIEIQSNDDEELCELQMLTCLFLLMNTRALEKLVGFLVYKSGQCRTYYAKREVNGNVVYEQNDLFHVSYIAEIFEKCL